MKMPPANMCVAFNGPPGIGKDTIAELLLKSAGSRVYRGTLATMIRKMAAEHYNMPEFPVVSADRVTKDKHYPGFPEGISTPRQALIFFSEKIIKPRHGADYFAERFAKELEPYPMSIMTDLGFDVEAHCLADRIDFNIIVQLHHPEFDFSGDSRGYVNIERDNVVTIRHLMRRGDPQYDANDINRKICLAFEDRYR